MLVISSALGTVIRRIYKWKKYNRRMIPDMIKHFDRISSMLYVCQEKRIYIAGKWGHCFLRWSTYSIPYLSTFVIAHGMPDILTSKCLAISALDIQSLQNSCKQLMHVSDSLCFSGFHLLALLVLPFFLYNLLQLY